MTTEQMIEVMQAYVDGEQIEYFDNEEAKWLGCDPDCDPLWNWELFDYRAKPKSDYRPYKNADEFLKDQKEHGMYIVIPDILSDCYVLPLCVNEFVNLRYNSIKNGPVETLATYDFLFDNYKWLDGTPCGVKEE